MKKFSDVCYAVAMALCAIECGLCLLTARTDIFVMFLIFEAILCIGWILDEFAKSKKGIRGLRMRKTQ